MIFISHPDLIPAYKRADLQVTITGLDPEASAAAIDARLGRP